MNGHVTAPPNASDTRRRINDLCRITTAPNRGALTTNSATNDIMQVMTLEMLDSKLCHKEEREDAKLRREQEVADETIRREDERQHRRKARDQNKLFMQMMMVQMGANTRKRGRDEDEDMVGNNNGGNAGNNTRGGLGHIGNNANNHA